MIYQNGRYYIVVGAPENRRDISVEIYIDNEQWAEVYDDNGPQVAEFYGRDSGKPWEIPLLDAADLLKRAREELDRRPRKK